MLDTAPFPDASGTPKAFADSSVPINYGAGIDKKSPAYVYANHGRWVVECPDCHSAQLAHRDDRRFMCCECGNAVISGRWRPVAWPNDEKAIEAELEKRLLKLNQNWFPGETVQMLREEAQHAAEPPEPLPGPHAGKASAWEGHTHDWPKRLGKDKHKSVACKECGLILQVEIIEAGYELG